jgi:hypothetical protein
MRIPRGMRESPFGVHEEPAGARAPAGSFWGASPFYNAGEPSSGLLHQRG